MKTLGIIGGENSHSWLVANVCNDLKKVPLRATHIWGETDADAEKAARIGKIPHIVKNWKELFGKVDAVMIDQRDGNEHVAPARYFLERKVPVFVDKPLTCKLATAKALFALAKKKNTPLLTFTAKPLQRGFVDFRKMLARHDIRAVNASGPAAVDGPWGGIFFYGIHQVDAVLDLLGTEVEKVSLVRQKDNGVASLFYRDGRFATLNLIKEGSGGFHWRACGEKGVFTLEDQNDKIFHLKGTKIISDFVNKGIVPFSEKRMLAPIAILEALAKSLHSGKTERVSKF